MVCIVYRRKDYNHMVREQVDIPNIFYSDLSSSSSLEAETTMRANIISGIFSILFFQSYISITILVFQLVCLRCCIEASFTNLPCMYL